MFKFFRRYNKYMLPVGGVLLMIVFLIQGTVGQLFGGNPAKREIGRIGGKEVLQLEIDQAGQELDVLRELLRGLAASDPLSWMLLKREARSIGLSASDAEVDRVLAALGVDQRRLARIADSRHAAPQRIREALRAWVSVQNCMELLFARTHRGLEERIGTYRSIEQLAGRGLPLPFIERALDMLNGQYRISRPLLQRFVQQTDSTLSISAVSVSSLRYLGEVETPPEARLQELFERYRDVLPGAGEPYGLGYRFPDRVKLEYLEIPAERLHERVVVSEAEALAHYRAYPDQFREAPTGGAQAGPAAAAGAIQPYEAVRARIFAELRQRHAWELGEAMINAARSILLNDERRLRVADGYRVLDGTWEPLPMDELAQQLQQQKGLLPTVQRLDDRWLDPAAIQGLAGIGQARLAGSSPAPLVAYVLSAREFQPAENNPLATLRLQAHIASAPLVSPLGSWYLFRLTAAEAEHRPDSLAAVRDQVLADAKRLAAYEKLLAQRDSWRDRARSEKLEDLAAELNTAVLSPAAFPRRRRNVYFGHLEVPEVAGIGREAALVDRVYEMAEEVAGAGGAEAATPAQRIDAIALDGQQSLVLVRIDRYLAISGEHYASAVKNPGLPDELTYVLAAEQTASPVSADLLSKRVGFVRQVEPQAPPAEPAAGDGQGS